MKRLISMIGALSVILGCGETNESLRIAGGGQVTLNGNPVEAASISFLPVDGDGPAAMVEVSSGRYKFDEKNGPLAGKHKVVIRLLANDKFKQAEGPQQWELTYEVPETGLFAKDFELGESGKPTADK